jgi:LPS export ABC transporter protein LptC
MGSWKKRVLLYAVLGCLVGVGGLLFLNRDLVVEEAATALLAPLDNQELTLNNIHHVATRDGRTEWTLDAESARYDRKGGRTLFKEVSATFFLEGGEEVQLSGRDGVLLTETKDMEVSGGVTVRSGPYELNTEQLFYAHGTRTISTELPVRIRGDLLTMTGESMVFNLDTDLLVVSGQVEAVLEGLSL